MDDWLQAAAGLDEPAILVTVATVEGSAPREAGASMLVSRNRLFDTVGGGHLEFRALELAREMLHKGRPGRRLERMALGPSLGQCCGGVVRLLFEPVTTASRSHFARLVARRSAGQDSWRLIPLDDEGAPAITDRHGRIVEGMPPAFRPEPAGGCSEVTDNAGQRWLMIPCQAPKARLFLFGAGHVGSALVRILAHLPCQVTWVDEREQLFPQILAANIRIEATDIPEAVIDQAPPGSSFLVMTHSHALDQRLAEHILRRNDTGWFGLIGSRTKRRQFEHRLRARGIPEQRLAAMTCPIGVAGIHGKQPSVIAVSVAAQLLQVWESMAANDTLHPAEVVSE